MSYARPCLVSSIPPHRDVISDSRNGYLHDENSYDDLCKRLRQLDALDVSTRGSVGKAARETVAEGYDWEDIIDSVERCYEAALGKAVPAQKSA